MLLGFFIYQYVVSNWILPHCYNVTAFNLSLSFYIYIVVIIVSINMNLSKWFVINLPPHSLLYPVFPALTTFNLLCSIISLLTLYHSIICLLLSKDPFTLVFLLVFYHRAYDLPCNGFLSVFIVVAFSGEKIKIQVYSGYLSPSHILLLRYSLTQVYCCSVYNSQEIESIQQYLS